MTAAKDSQQRDHRHKQDRRNNNRGDVPASDNEPPNQVGIKNSSNKKCYIYNQTGHLERNCRHGQQEREATANLNRNGTGADTRQVSTEDSGTLSSIPAAERSEMLHSKLPPMGSVDPLSYLYSSDSRGSG